MRTVAIATEDLSSSVKEISQNVSDTAKAARSCADSALDSQHKLSGLQCAVGDIDGVIQAINDVAEQTNLLALNATIEAARAGEAGKGFAVVASEVKTLAGETHKMTEEISNKVEEIKSSAMETIDAVTKIIEQINSVDSQTGGVAAAVEEQNSSTEEISRNIQNAAVRTDDVSRNIEEVKRVASESASSTEALQKSAGHLSEQALELKSAMQEFLSEIRAT